MSTDPTGLGYNQTVLPHSPYKNATGAIVHAWMSQGHWASWFFEVPSPGNQYICNPINVRLFLGLLRGTNMSFKYLDTPP